VWSLTKTIQNYLRIEAVLTGLMQPLFIFATASPLPSGWDVHPKKIIAQSADPFVLMNTYQFLTAQLNIG
jgi:hypothetical protein